MVILCMQNRSFIVRSVVHYSLALTELNTNIDFISSNGIAHTNIHRAMANLKGFDHPKMADFRRKSLRDLLLIKIVNKKH